MCFYIQASNPKSQDKVEIGAGSLADAIENTFLMNTENAILMWNYISIPLSYKYDISYMIEDIVSLLSEMQNKESGEMIIHWLPDTFRSDWVINWNEGQVEIQSQWECTVGHLEKILNENPGVMVSINSFMSEWKEVLYNVIKGLKKCGYNEIRAQNIQKLWKVYENIKESGFFYS